MFYYKLNDVYYTSNQPLNGYIEITEEEYIKATTPTEEEIRAEKETQLRTLMNELYPVED